MNTTTQPTQKRQEAKQRQIMTLVFAILLIWFSSSASAQSQQGQLTQGQLTQSQSSQSQSSHSRLSHSRLYYAAANPSIDAALAVEFRKLTGESSLGVHDSSVSVQTPRQAATIRPQQVQLAATLANFDADADPDGWLVEVVLLDGAGNPVVVRATARFELTPRVSRAGGRHFGDASGKLARWTKRLEFDQDGVARVRLPLRNSLRGQAMGRGASAGSADLIGAPPAGELRVRVSVPTAGVFAAATPVRIRPSALLDTRWPYR